MTKSKFLALGLLALLCPLAAHAGEFTQATLERAYDKVLPAIGLVEYSIEVVNERTGEPSRRDSNALALVVSPTGLVMTHGHMVLENAKPFNIRVKLGDGEFQREYEANLLQKPDDVNVAFLQLKASEPLNLPYVRFSKTHDLRIGESLALYGLLGESLDFSTGLEEARIGAILEHPRKTYCLDSNIRFGFVGGPVVDLRGEVIGVVGFDLSRTEGGEVYARSGHPLVYQADLFQKYIQAPPGEPRTEDTADDAWLGVFTQPLTDDFARYWELPATGGLIVSTVVPQSPAAVAGLLTGDIITKFGDYDLKAKQDRDVIGFTKMVREAGPGKTIVLGLLRAGQPTSVEVTLGSRPRTSGDAAEFEVPRFGLTVRELTRDLRIALNLAEDVQGVIVRRVTSGSVAQLGKLQPGVVIVRFGGHVVSNVAEFKVAVEKVMEEKPKEVSVFGRIGSASTFFRLDPRWEE